MRKFIVSALVIFGALCAPTVAEISDETVARYNAAVQANDVPSLLTAAEALAGEAVASPDDRDAALLAFEAAWALCRNGECGAAIPAAEFALGLPSNVGEHPTREDRRLLLAYAEWTVEKTSDTRTALDAELSDRVESSPTLLTVSAFHNRYINDLSEGRARMAQKTAAAAATHMEQAKDQLGQLWSGAELAVHTTHFNEKQSPDALIGIAELYAELKLMFHVAPSPAPEWLRNRYYETNAWWAAMYAYFRSEDTSSWARRRAQKIVDDAITDDNHTHMEGDTTHAEDRIRSCPGNLNRPPSPKYPQAALNEGYVGAVIVAFDVNEEGRIDARVAASVPSDKFDEAVLESMERLKWNWEEPSPDAPPCRKEVKNVIQPFEFAFAASYDVLPN